MAIFSNLKGTFQSIFSLGTKGQQVQLIADGGVLKGTDANEINKQILRPEKTTFVYSGNPDGITPSECPCPVYCNPSGEWTRAIADDPDTLASAVVIKVDGNDLTICTGGRVDATTHGMVKGHYYFVSPSHAGVLISSDEITVYSNPIVFIDSDNTYLVGSWRPSARDIGILGIFSGGTRNYRSDYIFMASLGNAIRFNSLYQITSEAGGCGSTTRGIIAGGTPSTDIDVIQYLHFQSKENTVDFGDLLYTRSKVAGFSNATRGLFHGNRTGGYANDLDYITIATLGNASDFGNTIGYQIDRAGIASTTRGVIAGGVWTGGERTAIDYVTIATTGNALNFGNLVLGRHALAGVASATRGVFSSGNVVSMTDYITIASTGSATNFGANTFIGYIAGVTDSLKGVFSGMDSTTTVNALTYLMIASTGNVSDFGDLLVGNENSAGMSNGHGGL